MKTLIKIAHFCFELSAGLKATSGLGNVVTVFGSTRLKPGDPNYEAAVEFGRRAAEAGYSVLTGAGPGIMEGANRGAVLGGGRSVGCRIILPFEQISSNPFISKGREARFKRFFLRKFCMTRSSDAFVVFPGGFGTMDELFEILTLVQCGKNEKQVVIALYGSDFWNGLVGWMGEKMLSQYKTISGKDLFLFHVVDSVDEAVSLACREKQTYPISLFPQQS